MQFCSHYINQGGKVNVCDIQQGAVKIIELNRTGGDHFEMAIAVRSEAVLQYNDTSNSTFLTIGGNHVWAVEGADKKNSSILSRLMERNLPRLCWVMAASPKRGDTKSITLQAHEFPSRYEWSEPLDLGIDEKIVDDIRKKRSRLDSVDGVVKWLTEVILISSAQGIETRRAILSGSPSPQTGGKEAFRLWGERFAVDVVKDKDDRFIVNKLVTSTAAFGNSERRPIVLVEGQIKFCDSTIAGRFRGFARTELDRIVDEAGSYLGVWREYNKLEKENILSRARVFGQLAYNKFDPLPDGAFRFHLGESDEKVSRSCHHLRENENITLEISDLLPGYLQQKESETETYDFDDFESNKNKAVLGECVSCSIPGKTMTIRPLREQEERTPPEKGVLYISAVGDKFRLKRREDAHSAILTAKCPMPQLGLLIENKPAYQRRGKIYKPLSPESRKMFGGTPTERQKLAIDIALNTPDIALIQGPPGTGKTDVIAALQVRLAEISEERDNISGSYCPVFIIAT